MTEDQRIQAIIELARPLSEDGIGEALAHFTIELGARRAMREARRDLTNDWRRYEDITVPGWNE